MERKSKFVVPTFEEAFDEIFNSFSILSEIPWIGQECTAEGLQIPLKEVEYL